MSGYQTGRRSRPEVISASLPTRAGRQDSAWISKKRTTRIYVEDAPITFIRDVKAPLLVLQGDNDPRVPKEEAQQIVDILKKQGRVVEVQYYANEGHGFVKRENQIDAIRRTVDWFEQYLKGNLSATSNQKH